MQDLLPHPDLAQLRTMATESAAITTPCSCRTADSRGWISLPLSLPETQLVDVATLITDPYDEPTFTEYHPHGTRYASPEAPIAPAWYPCNRCNIARCTQCGRLYLRYMEAGGYFVDRRIRSLADPTLIVETT